MYKAQDANRNDLPGLSYAFTGLAISGISVKSAANADGADDAFGDSIIV